MSMEDLLGLMTDHGLFAAESLRARAGRGDLTLKDEWMAELRAMRRGTLSGEPDDMVFAAALAPNDPGEPVPSKEPVDGTIPRSRRHCRAERPD